MRALWLVVGRVEQIGRVVVGLLRGQGQRQVREGCWVHMWRQSHHVTSLWRHHASRPPEHQVKLLHMHVQWI